MNEFGSMSEIAMTVIGVGLMGCGAREAWRDKSNAGARMQGLLVIGIGLLLIK